MLARGVAALVAGALLSPGSAPVDAHVLFRFADPRIAEASGIARGIASPGVFYVQNDSGDSPRFFAVDRRTGATAATVVVRGARNIDWEDIAAAENRRAGRRIWLADIGDNDAVRRTVQIYQVVEPRIDPSWRDRTVRVHVSREWRLRYPGGPVDAESLAVGPDGRAYIVSKSIGGATVYRVPLWRPGGTVQKLRRIGHVTFHPTGTDNPFGIAGQLTATGAAISTTGIVFAIRTYSDVWAWRIRGNRIGAVLRHPPVIVPLPAQPQGEGLAVLGRAAVVDSEQAGSAVYTVPLPRAVTHLPVTIIPPTEYHPSASPPASAVPDAGVDDGSLGSWLAGIAAGLVAAAGIGLGLRARRRR